MLDQFAVDLTFFLADRVTAEDVRDAFEARFSQLDWGEEASLLKACADWPEAVVQVKVAPTDPEDRFYVSQYPVGVNALVFPQRYSKQQDIMLPTRIALLQWLAWHYECRVICNAREYASDGSYSGSESFMCSGGRVFSSPYDPNSIRYMQPSEAHHWQPLDDLPAAELDAAGKLTLESMISASKSWRLNREHPAYPKTDHAEGLNWSPDEVDDDATPWDPPYEKAEDESDDELDEHFRRIDEFTSGRGKSSSKKLIEEGVSLPPPDSMDDETLSEKMWDIIHRLARAHNYLSSTNHLTDRELYTYLWTEQLNRPMMDLTGLTGSNCRIDLLGSGSEEDVHLHMIYYASPEDRADWKANVPKAKIPAHQEPICQRDKLLPRPPGE